MLREIRTAGAQVPAMVEQAMTRCAREYGAAYLLPHGSDAEQAHRAEQLAAVCERRARWWGVLLAWAFTPICDLPWVFGAALIDARRHEQSAARFWREVAADAHARHATRVVGSFATAKRTAS